MGLQSTLWLAGGLFVFAVTMMVVWLVRCHTSNTALQNAVGDLPYYAIAPRLLVLERDAIRAGDLLELSGTEGNSWGKITMSIKTLPDNGSYVPIGERINQDVWHDNFVPKYSGLASAKAKPVVIIGVWLIFGPWAIFSLAWIIDCFGGSESPGAFLFSLPFAIGQLLIAFAILYSQTRRYIQKRSRDEPVDDDPAEGPIGDAADLS